MSFYQSETVHSREWFDRPQSVVIEPSIWYVPTNNLLTAQATSAKHFPLIRVQLQMLVEGIVLDQELIAECRSGEI